MKTEILTKKNGKALNGFSIEDIGDDHLFTSFDTPIKPGAFDMSDKEKKERISILFSEIMDVLGLDLTDDSLQGTPDRVAKMYIEEIFSGLDPKNKPKIALFDNKYQYNQMLVEKDITFSLKVLGSFNAINLILSPSCIVSYFDSLCFFNRLL